MAAWRIDTIEPANKGDNYIALVHRPAGYLPHPATPGPGLRAENTSADQYSLRYKADPAGRALIDAWDTGIPFLDSRPHEIQVRAYTAGGGDEGEERPTIADGAGGGAGGTKKTRINYKKIRSLKRNCPK